MSVLLSLSVSLWFIARKGKGAQCVTYRHTYMHVYRPSDKRVSGEQLLLLKKKEKKRELRFVVLIFLGAGRKKDIKNFYLFRDVGGERDEGEPGGRAKEGDRGFFSENQGVFIGFVRGKYNFLHFIIGLNRYKYFHPGFTKLKMVETSALNR